MIIHFAVCKAIIGDYFRIYGPPLKGDIVLCNRYLINGLIFFFISALFFVPQAIASFGVPVSKLGLNGMRVAYSTFYSSTQSFIHLFNIKKMELEDERLRFYRFKGISRIWRDYSLSYVDETTTRARIEVRWLGERIKQIDWRHLPGREHNIFGFVKDGYWVSGGQEGQLFLYNKEGEYVASLTGHKGTVISLACHRRWLVSGDDHGLVLVWNIDKPGMLRGKVRPSLYLVFDENGRWVAWCDEGVWSSSDTISTIDLQSVSGMYDVTFSDHLKSSFLLAEKLVDPKRFAKELRLRYATHGIIPVPPRVEILDLPAKIKGRDLQVSIKVCDAGVEIESASMFLNGKLILLDEDSRGIKVVREEGNYSRCKLYLRNITLWPGKNEITVMARNEMGLESSPVKREVYSDGLDASERVLYLVLIAVSNYADADLNLLYPAMDARSIAEAFEVLGSGYFKDIKTYLLIDHQVTKKRIQALFKTLNTRIRQEDVFVLYLAGHGSSNSEGTDYYFLPYNVDISSAAHLYDTSLTTAFFKTILSQISAVNSLILVDTCHSGALAEKGFEGSSLSLVNAKVVNELGKAIIMASAKDQVAYEGFDGHGAFTRVLLEGLDGKADYSSDGLLSVDELSAFVSQRLSDITEKKWGYRQRVVRNLNGHDFILGKIK